MKVGDKKLGEKDEAAIEKKKTWELSQDPKTLTIVRKILGPQASKVKLICKGAQG